MNPTPPLSAGARVAAIPELLEKILLNVAHHYDKRTILRTILVSQRTSHAFRNTITGSPLLQRALWLAPSDADCTPWDRIDINPILLRRTIRSEDTSFTVEVKPEEFCNDIYCWSMSWRGRDNSDRSASWRRMYIYRGKAGIKPEVKKVYTDRSVVFEMDGNWEDPKAGDLFDYLSSRVQAENKAKALVADARINTNPPPSAGDRVASVPKLLEHILLDLARHEDETVALRTLLVSQRTSRGFRDTIMSSPKLRRALWFDNSNRLEDMPEYPALDFLQKGTRFYGNPLLDYLAPLPDETWVQVSLHFLERDRALGITFERDHDEGKPITRFQDTNPTASWRRMYACRSPSEKIVFAEALRFDGNTTPMRLTGRWENPKLGDMFHKLFLEEGGSNEGEVTYWSDCLDDGTCGWYSRT